MLAQVVLGAALGAALEVALRAPVLMPPVLMPRRAHSPVLLLLLALSEVTTRHLQQRPRLQLAPLTARQAMIHLGARCGTLMKESKYRSATVASGPGTHGRSRSRR